jgi:ribosomal protein S18 acetylase RimI-like enzyme
MARTGLSSRRYSGREDIPALLAFASRSTAERLPRPAQWHPGDVAWQLRGEADRPQAIRLWMLNSEVVATAWFVGPGQLWLEARPRHEGVVAEAVAWAEAALARREGGASSLSVQAFESDAARIACLEDLGYRRSGPGGVLFAHELTEDGRPDPTWPEGITIVDGGRVDRERRAAVHRDAWSDLAAIGLPEARSDFRTELYEAVRASPVYDPALDLVAVAPDGAYAACCIAWADGGSRVGVFEPMGTSPAFRGRRLASCLVAEGLRRLYARGCRLARIGTAHFNAPAIAAYRAVLSEPVDRTAWWAKPPLEDTP